MENSFSNGGTILVTGANGQLGKELQKIAGQYPQYQFLFTTKEGLPIDNFEKTAKFFEQQQIHYCINCAAYTAVDKAETESEKAYLINGGAVGNLATLCQQNQARFIHISTDYVFNGKGSVPYKEEDAIAPLNVYGASKLKGEELAFNNDPETLVIRTSWVYSSFGNNFVKTMLRLFKEKESINVVNDQFGCPTYAGDLAEATMTIIDVSKTKWTPGIVNYCNSGVINWHQFATAIKELTNNQCIINPIPSSQYKTPAPRPAYSVLDTNKIRSLFGITIPQWKESLEKCLKEL